MACERVESACDLLCDPAVSVESRVHDARRGCKELRSLIGLFAGSLAPEAAQKALGTVRQAAGHLAGKRDADVLLATYAHFRAQCRQTDKGMDDRIERYAQTLASHGEDASLEKAARLLDGLKRQTKRWKLACEGFDAVRGGLEAAYRRGRKRLQRAREIPDSERLHDWRKQVKAWQHQTRLLRDLWPVMQKTLQRELAGLATVLGDEHDLYLLAETLTKLELISGPSRQVFSQSIDLERVRLREMAWRAGLCLYAEKTGAYLARQEALWHTARQA